MEQQRALNALEPFLALSKTATSARAAADLVTQATSATHTYVFAELLATPSIQQLRTSQEYASYLRILEIFAWGSVSDYRADAQLPQLTQAQKDKLQLLSLLPLCKSRENLTYQFLEQQLGLADTQALEKLVTAAIYAGLIQGHLDPLHKVVRVSAVAPMRDLPPNSAQGLIATFDAWDERCASTLDDIETRIATIKKEAARRRTMEQRREKAFEDALKDSEKSGKRPAPAGGGDSLLDMMDVDEGIAADGRPGARLAKRVGRGLGLR